MEIKPTHLPQQSVQLNQSPAPVYQSPPVLAASNGVGVTGMVLGILGAVVGFWAIVPIVGYVAAGFGLPLALAAIICGHIGQARAKRIGGIGRGQARAAVILGYSSSAIMVIASLVWTVLMFVEIGF